MRLDATRAETLEPARTTLSGTNAREYDLDRLARVMIDENAELHLIAAEAWGGFDFLRRFGCSDRT